MKKRKCKFLSFLVACALCASFAFPLVSSASDEAQFCSSAEYDMTLGGTQEFTLINKHGKTVHVIITEEPSKERLENRTYKVSYEAPLSWRAGYNVVVRNNTISSVNSPWHTAITGSISAGRLTKDSSTQATYSMTRKLLTMHYKIGVRTTISGTTMKVFAI